MKKLLDKLSEPKCIMCKVVILLFFVIVFTGTDLVVKEVASQNLRGVREVEVIKGFWSFYYTENDDIGFSLLRGLNNVMDKQTKWLFLVILQGIGTLVVVIFYFYVTDIKQLIPLALIVSGALGNVMDRIIRGYVVDYVMWYLEFGGRPRVWPIFNLADVYTVIGVFVLLFVLLFLPEAQPSAGDEKNDKKAKKIEETETSETNGTAAEENGNGPNE